MRPSRARSDPAPSIVAVTDAGHVILPARWRPWQRRKNTALMWLIEILGRLWQRIPLAALTPLGHLVGAVAYTVAGRERRTALAQLQHAFPAWPARARRRVTRRMFAHLSRAALEAGRMDALLQRIPLPLDGRQVLDIALAEGRGVVAVTGHIGNWELLAQAVAHAGYPVTTVAKPLYDPRLTQWVHARRAARGLDIIWRGQAAAARQMLGVFRRGGLLALLIDQDTRVEGVHVPFFGRPAFTPTAAASLARRFDAPVVVAWTHRLDTTHHTFHFERVSYERTADADADVRELTRRLTARLECAIRLQPEQWVWLHERHKSQCEQP